MNDPWSNVIQNLSGAPAPTPEAWPDRKVHRTLDDIAEGPEPSRPRRPPRRGTAQPLAAQRAVEPAARFKCPCTSCARLGFAATLLARP